MKAGSFLATTACVLLAFGAGAQSAGAAAATPREVYEKYMAFQTLVDRCSVQTRWLADGTSVWYTDRATFPTQVYRFNATTGEREPLLDVARLRKAIADEFGAEPPANVLPFDAATLEVDAGVARFNAAGVNLQLDLNDYSLKRLPVPEAVELNFGTSVQERFTPRMFRRDGYMVGSDEAPEQLSPDRRWFASLREGNIWLRSTVDGRYTQITRDGAGEVAWDFETGVRSPWSPDGLFLFALRYDRSKVAKVPVVHVLKRDEEVQWWRFQKAGAPLDHGEVFIVPVLGKDPIRIDIGDTTDRYFRALGWLPDSSEALFARFSRDFKRVDVMAASARTGAVRTVFTEVSPTFVRIQHDTIWGDGDIGFTHLPKRREFLWLSERDGWKNLYLYDLQGKVVRQLTRGEQFVQSVVGVDETDGWVYFMASAEPRPYDAHLYRVPLRGGSMQRLTQGDGTHRVRLSPSQKIFIDTWSNVDRAPRTEVRRVDGSLVQVLGETDTTRLRSIGWTAPEEFKVKAADGKTDLWGVMYKPYNFDASRKYPVVEYIYGGPQSHNLPRDFCGSGSARSLEPNFPRALAQLGYIVVTVAARGTPWRSKAFQDVAYGDWADHVVKDHAAAIRQLAATRSYVDLQRVGIFGRSWGGYFSFRLLADAGDLYKAAVSIVPGFDPYGGMLYEPYLGMPEQNPAAYESASVFRLAPQVKGSLMMVGGTSDTSTYHDILRMTNALVEAGVHHELVILPNQEHLLGGTPAAYSREAIVRFFDRTLASGEAR